VGIRIASEEGTKVSNFIPHVWESDTKKILYPFYENQIKDMTRVELKTATLFINTGISVDNFLLERKLRKVFKGYMLA